MAFGAWPPITSSTYTTSDLEHVTFHTIIIITKYFDQNNGVAGLCSGCPENHFTKNVNRDYRFVL